MVSVLYGNKLPVYTGTVKFTNYPFSEIGWTKVLILLVNRKKCPENAMFIVNCNEKCHYKAENYSRYDKLWSITCKSHPISLKSYL